MKKESYKLEIITPCFCAGADQCAAEIRPASIRGELRWWFRALGGTSVQEKRVFGGVHGEASSSCLVLRVLDLNLGAAWTPPERINPNANNSYIYHFASVSGEPKGCRWSKDGCVPPRSTFILDIVHRRAIAASDESLLDKSIKAFLHFGALGLRQTRGLGSCSLANGSEREKIKELARDLLEANGFSFVLHDQVFPSWNEAIDFAGGLLKNVLRKNYNVEKVPESPLGNAQPRQTSAVRFRILKTNSEQYSLLIMEAPHDKVLGSSCRRELSVLKELDSQITNYNG